MAEQDSDRSEQATPHRLEDARKKGQVAKSVDFLSCAAIAVLTVVVQASGWDGLGKLLGMAQRTLARAPGLEWSVANLAAWCGQLLLAVLLLLAPLLMALVIAALLANLAQTGPIFSVHPVKPDFKRLNPVDGFKRIFSMRTLFEAGKSIVKLVVLAGVAWAAVSAALPGLMALPTAAPAAYPRILLELVGGLLGKLALALLLIAMADMGFVRWDYAKRMRMSKRDIKDEHKNREGDPRVRARIRELRKEMLKRSQSMRRMASADVLVTNPTRLAIALRYEHGSAAAPKVVAKGAGDLAARMRALAGRKNIPIVQNKPLARTLFREVDYDGYVPEKLYPQLAKIMVWVYAMREARRQSGRKN
ncbi:EscU/YscU/HrcU family type III secretion system export apparatus switch protein [Pseudoduganella sp. S-14]|jgi:flagellar biosynthesis protein FlhB|uniref:EscU/YscU/HrcU family type III secretion system export apparatus switch protein n=1 Tax=Pseudoduganella sp. S-14 TaxID=3404065 RepID=UPI003CF86A08